MSAHDLGQQVADYTAEQSARAAEFDAAVGNPSPHLLAVRDAREESAVDDSLSAPLSAAEFAIPPAAELASELGTLSPAEIEIALREREFDARVGEWNDGARIADSHFCQQCGQRGVRGRYCPACEEVQ